MNETPGLGTKVVDDKDFLRAVRRARRRDRARQDSKKVDTITGATKSSRGVRATASRPRRRVYAEVLSRAGR